LICDAGADNGRSAAWYASASSTRVPTPAIGTNTRSVTVIPEAQLAVASTNPLVPFHTFCPPIVEVVRVDELGIVILANY
jgi:hypothetical protein